jgi:hypothetical protein
MRYFQLKNVTEIKCLCHPRVILAGIYSFIILWILSVYIPVCTAAPQKDRFVYTQLKYDGDWDPYPYVHQDIFSLLTLTTSIKVVPDRRVITLKDDALFSSPFLVMLNNGKFTGFSDTERKTLVRYITNGGILVIEDSTAYKQSEFDKKIKVEMDKMFPDKRFTKLPKEHPIFRSFYLLRSIAGRKLTNNYLEGLDIDNRGAVIYSQNDVFGAWLRDKFGNYFLECIPGGENQRFEAQKLTLNIIIYSLTGTYKSDYVHKPFIEDKLRR